MNVWCRGVYLDNTSLPELKDYRSAHGNGVLGKAVSYLKDNAGILSIKDDKDWEAVTAIRDARNMIVHNGGRVKIELRAKFEKHGIGMREEDFSVYMDSDTFLKIYNIIIRFCDRIFDLRGLAFAKKQSNRRLAYERKNEH